MGSGESAASLPLALRRERAEAKLPVAETAGADGLFSRVLLGDVSLGAPWTDGSDF